MNWLYKNLSFAGTQGFAHPWDLAQQVSALKSESGLEDAYFEILAFSFCPWNKVEQTYLDLWQS